MNRRSLMAGICTAPFTEGMVDKMTVLAQAKQKSQRACEQVELIYALCGAMKNQHSFSESYFTNFFSYRKF